MMMPPLASAAGSKRVVPVLLQEQGAILCTVANSVNCLPLYCKPCTQRHTSWHCCRLVHLGSQLAGFQTWLSTQSALTSAVQIVLGPHVYGPSVTGAIYGYNGYWLWWRMSRSFGRKTTTGDSSGQCCKGLMSLNAASCLAASSA